MNNYIPLLKTPSLSQLLASKIDEWIRIWVDLICAAKMPMNRYEIRDEYSLADPELYRAADKDDPEALLEGVAMAGLVGVLRQLGDLAEWAYNLPFSFPFFAVFLIWELGSSDLLLHASYFCSSHVSCFFCFFVY